MIKGGTKSQPSINSYVSLISSVKDKLNLVLRKTRFTQAKGGKKWTYLDKLGKASAGLVIGGILTKNQIFTLHCDAKSHQKTRLVGVAEQRVTEDVDFDWKQFGRLLWEDIFSLALAVLVCTVYLSLYLSTVDAFADKYLMCMLSEHNVLYSVMF